MCTGRSLQTRLKEGLLFFSRDDSRKPLLTLQAGTGISRSSLHHTPARRLLLSSHTSVCRAKCGVLCNSILPVCAAYHHAEIEGTNGTRPPLTSRPPAQPHSFPRTFGHCDKAKSPFPRAHHTTAGHTHTPTHNPSKQEHQQAPQQWQDSARVARRPRCSCSSLRLRSSAAACWQASCTAAAAPRIFELAVR